MRKNRVKMICSENRRSISYYLQNESREWIRVSNASILSRKKYLNTTIKESGFDILKIIDETYNPGNRGVDLYFEGSDENFSILQSILKENFAEENIVCHQRKTKIAVAGKIGSGKTVLIEELSRLHNISYKKSKLLDFTKYVNEIENVEWYEINGIDLGKENIKKAKETIDYLMETQLTAFIYCMGTNKIEDLEEELISYLKSHYPELKLLIVLTRCVNETSDLFAKQLRNRFCKIEIMPILARELKTKVGIIPAFGIEQVGRYIFEGE